MSYLAISHKNKEVTGICLIEKPLNCFVCEDDNVFVCVEYEVHSFLTEICLLALM